MPFTITIALACKWIRSLIPDAVPLCTTHACIDDPTQSWVFWLCILFGFGFFLLLIVIVFLLSAVTCSCVSTEADRKGRKGSGPGSLTGSGRVNGATGVIEEFDPYARSWHGSQYGSRFAATLQGSTRLNSFSPKRPVLE